MESYPMSHLTDAPKGVDKLYFAAWRWHFYAGLYVAPFLIMLAVTGLIMVWVSSFNELNGERTAAQASGPPVAVSVMAKAAAAAVPEGAVTKYIEPRAAGKVALFRVQAGDASTAVLVDPSSGAVIEARAWGESWYSFANDIHGTLLIGDTGDRMIEIAAGFGIVLIVSGLYLWWPRNGEGLRAKLMPDLRASGRACWKSLHQSVGVWVAALLLVFLVSGMSWTGIWGDKFVQAWNSFPGEKWGAPLSDKTHVSLNAAGEKEVPWALEQTPLPASGSLAGTAALPEGAKINLDTITDYARSLGFNGRFQVNLPEGETGVWTISHDSMSNDGPDPWGDRTLHLDQYTGKVLADVRYADYTIYAKAMAWGIAFHEGDMGNWNLALNTLFCLSILFISASGLVMWWKRRPAAAGRLAAPPMPAEMPLWKGAAALSLIIAMAFPLVGLSLIALLVLDVFIIQNLPLLRRILN